MNISLPYIAISIIVLAIIIAVLAFYVYRNRKETRLSRLAAFAFLFILASMLFSDNRLVGYGLMGIGVLLAVVDIYQKSKRT